MHVRGGGQQTAGGGVYAHVHTACARPRSVRRNVHSACLVSGDALGRLSRARARMQQVDSERVTYNNNNERACCAQLPPASPHASSRAPVDR